MSNLFYRNPRLLILTVGIIVVAGLSSYHVLPRMEDPLLTDRSAIINTVFPGADAERVESLVTEKLEDQLLEIEQIKEIRSSSITEVSTIVILLRDDVYEPESVWSRVRDKLDDARAELPPEAFKPHFDHIYVRAYALIVALKWAGSTEPNYAILRRLAEELEDEIRAIRGTAEVDMFGDPDEEILVEIRPEVAASLGLTSAQLSRQIEASDAKVAAGQLRSDRGNFILEIDGQLDSLTRIGEIPIQYGADGRAVLLSDIASLSKTVVDPPGSLALVDGRPTVALGVFVRPDYRVDQWTRVVRDHLADFSDRLPRGVELSTVLEQNRYVESRLSGLLINLLLGGLAVASVVFFLMGWRSTLVIGTALPLSVLMVLSAMRFLDIPIHQMSITGLIIALGLLIDNAIVIVDEVSERLQGGAAPSEAVSQSVRHLAVPLFGSTMTTALAFAPIALMAGPSGEFVGTIATSVILAIVSSFLLAMTVVPTLTAFLALRPADPTSTSGRHAPDTDPTATSLRISGASRTWWRHGFSHARLSRWYRSSLDFLFRRPVWGIALGLALPLFGFVQARHLPEQFFPPADRDQIQIELELSAHASLAETASTVSQVREHVLQHDQVDSVAWFLGESAPTFYYNVVRRRELTPRYAQALVQLKATDRTREVIHELQASLDTSFPHARLLVRQFEHGPPFDAPVEMRLYGPDIDRLRELGDRLRGVLAVVPDVIQTRAELSEALPKLSVSVDEQQARLVGLDHAAIARQLNSTLEGSVGGSVLEATEELRVRVRTSNEQRAQLEGISSLDLLPASADAQRVVNNQYRGIPLTVVARIELEPKIAAIPHFNGRRMNEVQAFIAAGVLPAKVLSDFQSRLARSDFRLPPGYSFEFGGEASVRDDAIGNLTASVSVLMVLMIATLVLSFRSFRAAALIGTVAGLSMGLGFGALWMFGYPLGFMAMVGTMGLVGVAVNDAIVVLAALYEDPQARAAEPAAVREVVMRSTRHIVATSLTTMAGFTPLILGGGGFWPPVAVAIAGGVAGATILALYYVPSAYILVIGRRKSLPKTTQSDGRKYQMQQPSADHVAVLPSMARMGAHRRHVSPVRTLVSPGPTVTSENKQREPRT